MPRLAALLIILLSAVFSLPASAERRIALIVEPPSPPRSSGGSDEAGKLERLLFDTYGFVVIRTMAGRELEAKLKAFRQRAERAEFAFVYFGGRIEHDAGDNYLHAASERAGIGQSTLPLQSLLDPLSLTAKRSLVFIESFAGPLVGTSRQTGYGRIPALPNIVVSVVSRLPSRQQVGPSFLRTVATGIDEGGFSPSSLIAAAREQVYLDSAGLELMRSFGKLPNALPLVRAPDRSLLMGQLRDYVSKVCPEASELELIKHYASASGNFLAEPANELDSFSLDEIVRQLDNSKPCALPGSATTASLPPASTPPAPQDNPPAPPAAVPPKAPEKEDNSKGNSSRPDNNSSRDRSREQPAKERERALPREREPPQRERKAAAPEPRLPKQRETSAPRSAPAVQRNPSPSRSPGSNPGASAPQ